MLCFIWANHRYKTWASWRRYWPDSHSTQWYELKTSVKRKSFRTAWNHKIWSPLILLHVYLRLHMVFSPSANQTQLEVQSCWTSTKDACIPIEHLWSDEIWWTFDALGEWGRGSPHDLWSLWFAQMVSYLSDWRSLMYWLQLIEKITLEKGGDKRCIMGCCHGWDCPPSDVIGLIWQSWFTGH